MQDHWQIELETYIKQGEPTQVEKSCAWQTAIGLQAVDGLYTSPYLLDTAKEHIEGKINITEAQNRIQNYYQAQEQRTKIELSTKEADIVSSRITKLLGEKAFQFSPIEWFSIHKQLFDGVFAHAGQARDYNITKNEWVLGGDTVTYAAATNIQATLEYDFTTEKNFSYDKLSLDEAIKHLTQFTSNIWQIHPFAEGNTRSTAVFIIKYLQTFGFNINNETFKNNSWYFRNALVRANYNNFQKNIHASTKYLELFFYNLLLNEKYELKNRYLHINYNKPIQENPATNNVSFNSNNNITIDANSAITNAHNLQCTLEETALLQILANNPSITQKELAKVIGKSERTVKNRLADLQAKAFLRRANGKRYGKWEVLIAL